jgi:hypothetical protein
LEGTTVRSPLIQGGLESASSRSTGHRMAA